MTPRPSTHNPITKSYAIDQITDIEQLRKVAHRMWEALVACRAQGEHSFRVAVGDDTCEPCQAAIDGDPDAFGCDHHRTWQRLVDRGFGSV
ncbi:hypothetical protein ACFFMR_19040 [Micromonospora andamanensis]|uniref:Uncharacterized protein n=1 Tax=Micromonospora andamanensis TaxID=1287068 RepID=A0ABQ4HYP6_9ACTN|nr:hypothetical protein [Micromonospora andamanensis]GIJ10764.1 hypothetical protein Van01_39780 [Micromonospora andamanensis]